MSQKIKPAHIRKRLQINNKIKLSTNTRKTLIIIAVAIFALGSGTFLKAVTGHSETAFEANELYTYKNNFKEEAKINIVDNQYISEDEVKEGQMYLSDLISNIDMKMNYTYTGSKESKVKYNYKIEAITKAIYTSNRDSYEVLNKTENLRVSGDQESENGKISIQEDLRVDYAKYHEIIKGFKYSMGISTESYLYVRLTVNTKAIIENQEIDNTYVNDYKITLGDKVAVVSANPSDSNEKSVKEDAKQSKRINIDARGIVIGIVLMAAGALLFRQVYSGTEELKIVRNEFKLELNRIMKSCESKLVEIEDLKQIDIIHATKVKDISQLLKLSDEALVPIYCYIKEEPEEAYFIVQKYEQTYIYILR